MNRPDLNTIGPYWLRALRLLDWRVSFEYVRDLCADDGSPVYGLCSRVVDNKTAHIRVRDPETPIPGAVENDPEEVVIHEVSHLHFAPFDTRRPAEVAAEENAVWAFADALFEHKGTPRAQMVARAMVAHARPQKAAAPARATRRMVMEGLAMLLAALKAALAMEDPQAAKDAALGILAEAEKATGSAPPAPAEAAPPAEGEEEEEPKPPAAKPGATKPAPAARPAATKPLDMAAVRKMASEAATSTLDGYKRDELLEKSGSALSADDLRWAKTQPYDTVRRMVGLAGPKEAAKPSPRGTSPARGTGTVDTVEDIVNRRMGIKAVPPQAVTIDPISRKMTISALRPVVVQSAEGVK
jgi:hypothetical protein